VLGYDMVRALFRDSRFVIPKGIALSIQGITSGPVWDRVTKLLLNLDGAEHHRLRRLVAKGFTPRAAERIRSACVDTMTELVDEHAPAGHCDVVADIARPYPIPIICALLGAPRVDWKLFSEWTDDISKAFTVDVVAQTPAIVRGWERLEAYIEEMVAVRRASPGDDLISELIRAEDGGEQLTHVELVSLVAILLQGGTDTTRNQLAAAVQVLCEHPDQWALLARQPELAPQAVEELLRHSPINFRSLRMATEDVELGGVAFPAGSFVIANMAAANRDPAVYDEPGRLDITRQAPPAMLAFGTGVHHCLGAHLARIELTEGLRVMTARMCNPRRTGPAPWKPVTQLSGPITLPVDFDAAN
jgi:cytochrome P450